MKYVLKILRKELSELNRQLSHDELMHEQGLGSEDYKKLRLQDINENKKHIKELKQAITKLSA